MKTVYKENQIKKNKASGQSGHRYPNPNPGGEWGEAGVGGHSILLP